MMRFHRVMSITLLVLASLMLFVELFRAGSLFARIILIAVLILFCMIVQRLSTNLVQWTARRTPL